MAEVGQVMVKNIKDVQEHLDNLFKDYDPLASKNNDKILLRNDLLSINAKKGFAASGSNWHKKLKKRNANKSSKWIGKISKTISLKQSDPEYKKHMSKMRTESMDQLVDGENITLREKITIANRKSAKDPIHHANRTKANRETRKKQYWKDAHSKGVLKYSEEVMTPDGIYPSLARWMTENTNCNSRSVLTSFPHLFWKTDRGQGAPTYERIYHTPLGIFASDLAAHNFHRKSKDPEALKLNHGPNWFFKMNQKHPKKYGITFEIAKYWPKEKQELIGMGRSKPRYDYKKMLSLKKKCKTLLK